MPDPRQRRRPIAVILTVCVMIMLAGCGFQPRGGVRGVADVPSPLYIGGLRSYSSLHRALKKQLDLAGVVLADTAATSAAVLNIKRHDVDSRVLSVDNRNRTVERELEETAHFELRSPDTNALLTKQTVRVLRIQFAPRVSVLGNQREEETLRTDMRQDLARRILRRITAQQ